MSSNDKAIELCKIISSLNYDGQQTVVTPQSFAKPNFTLVYDLLKWFARILVGKPGDLSLAAYSIEDDSGKAVTELAKSAVEDSLISLGRLFYSRLGINLNLVQIYKADTGCCIELLKIAKPIHKAVESIVNDNGKYADLPFMTKMLDSNRAEMEATAILLKDEIAKGKGKKDLTASISELAEKLEMLLENEQNFNEERQKVIDQRLELADIEQVLRTNHESIIQKTEELARSNEDLCKDLERLDERLRFKEQEVDSSFERLNDLLVESPQYLDQYEKLYKDYEASYEAYVSRYRNLNYLESCVYLPDNDNDNSNDHPIDHLDDADEKPLGSTAGGWLSLERPLVAGAATEGGFRTEDGELLSVTVGPPRLAESLPDDGGSKPTSASLGVDGTGAGAGVGRFGTTGDGPAREGRGRDTNVEVTGRRRIEGRPTVAGDNELEGLLREFVADSKLETRFGLYGAELKADDDEDITDDDGPGSTPPL